MNAESLLPTDYVVYCSPAELRSIADLSDSGERTSLATGLHEGAEEIRAIADDLERSKTVVVEHPVYRSVFKLKNQD